MVKILILLMYLITCHSSNCTYNETQVIRSLDAMKAKGIIQFKNDKIKVNFKNNFNLKSIYDSSYIIDGKKIKIVNSGDGLSWILFTSISSSENEPDITTINFKAENEGMQYDGILFFECYNGNLIYKDIHYISSVE